MSYGSVVILLSKGVLLMSTTHVIAWEDLNAALTEWEAIHAQSTGDLSHQATEMRQLVDELASFASQLSQREAAIIQREKGVDSQDSDSELQSIQTTAHETQSRLGELVGIFSDLRDELAHQETLEELRVEISDLRKLNARLAAELSVARGRSKQLYQAMLNQQELLEQRGVVTDNLLHIRRLLHSHSELLAHLAQATQKPNGDPIVSESQDEDPILHELLEDLRRELEDYTAETARNTDSEMLDE